MKCSFVFGASRRTPFIVVACLLFSFIASAPAQTTRAQIAPATPVRTTQVIAIAAGTDDAEEQGVNEANPGAMYLVSTDLELVDDLETPSFGSQFVGLRFVGIAAPQGATITSAYVTFSAVSADSPNTNDGPTTLVIAGEAAGNPAAFNMSRYNISGRPATSATVAWSPAPWAAGQSIDTPGLTPIIQEIVSRPDWSPGASMVLIISGSGSRSASSFEGGAGNAARLHVEWGGGASWAIYLPLVQSAEPAAALLVNGDFESGPQGWQEFSAQSLPIVVQGYGLLAIAPHSGAWGAWLAGTHNEVSFLQQAVLIPPDRPILSYWHFILSEDSCGHDRAGVVIDGATVDRYDLCRSKNTTGWALHRADLRGYAGRTVQLQIRAETNGSEISHYLVDDVTFEAAR